MSKFNKIYEFQYHLFNQVCVKTVHHNFLCASYYYIRNSGYNSDVINDFYFIASYITKKSDDTTSILNDESKWIKKKVRL